MAYVIVDWPHVANQICRHSLAAEHGLAEDEGPGPGFTFCVKGVS